MPMRKDAYPASWADISLRIRERAGHKCEWCGVPNYQRIVRSVRDGRKYIIYDEERELFTWPDGRLIRLSEIPEEFAAQKRAIRVVLTVHHIGAAYPDGSPGDPHDKMDCRDENLVALCQRCHLLADREFHKANRRRTMARKKTERMAEIGQRELL